MCLFAVAFVYVNACVIVCMLGCVCAWLCVCVFVCVVCSFVLFDCLLFVCLRAGLDLCAFAVACMCYLCVYVCVFVCLCLCVCVFV